MNRSSKRRVRARARARFPGNCDRPAAGIVAIADGRLPTLRTKTRIHVQITRGARYLLLQAGGRDQSPRTRVSTTPWRRCKNNTRARARHGDLRLAIRPETLAAAITRITEPVNGFADRSIIRNQMAMPDERAKPRAGLNSLPWCNHVH